LFASCAFLSDEMVRNLAQFYIFIKKNFSGLWDNGRFFSSRAGGNWPQRGPLFPKKSARLPLLENNRIIAGLFFRIYQSGQLSLRPFFERGPSLGLLPKTTIPSLIIKFT
jgi:hypothetical protein